MGEELSFGSVWVGDSLIDSPRYEPLTILGAVSTRTSKVNVGGSIIQPHFRHPVLLALSWATLDILSSGRSILTLGIGGGTPDGVAKEAELMGLDVADRGKALEETVQILRLLWKGNETNFDGEVYRFRDIKIGYIPVQKPPPIWIAAGIWVPKKRDKAVSATPGYTKKEGVYLGAFDRVARLGDGWFSIMMRPEEYEDAWHVIKEGTKKYGRSPSQITRAIECWINLNSNRQEAKEEIANMIKGYFSSPVDSETIERWSIYGTAQDCANKIEAYSKAGVQLIKFIMGSPDQLRMLREVGNNILPSFV